MSYKPPKYIYFYILFIFLAFTLSVFSNQTLKERILGFYTISEYMLILVSAVSSILLIKDINYAKFPMITLDSNKSNLINIIGIFIILRPA